MASSPVFWNQFSLSNLKIFHRTENKNNKQEKNKVFLFCFVFTEQNSFIP